VKQLSSQEDLAAILAAEKVALFCFVDWSRYARDGARVFEDAEARLSARPAANSVSWWIADVSSTTSPGSALLHQWIISQEKKGSVRTANIWSGNGFVIWAKRGEIVGSVLSAIRAGPEQLLREAEKAFAE
jgi:hypothetical protein